MKMHLHEKYITGALYFQLAFLPGEDHFAKKWRGQYGQIKRRVILAGVGFC